MPRLFRVLGRVLSGLTFLYWMSCANLLLGKDVAQSRDLNGEVLTDKGEPLPGAVCTLAGGLLPQTGVSATTGEKGGFEFQGILPGRYTLTCASVGFEPVVKQDLEVT